MSRNTDNQDKLTVYADERWPPDTSIGNVQERYKARIPPYMEVVDLKVKGRIGSPLSTLNISRALRQNQSKGRSVFFSAGFVPPLWSSIPTVVVVHDLAHRHTYGPAKRLYYDKIFRPLFRKCSAIICVSEYTRSELISWAALDPNKVYTVHNGRPESLNSTGLQHQPGYRYIFYCGHQREHKNLKRMVEAYCRSSLPAEGVRFVFTNGVNPELVCVAKKFGQAEKLIFTGFLSEDELHCYFRGAEAIAYVSLLEGFGLPILEGFAAEVPVLTSNVTSMPEVAADAALLVNPQSIDEIQEGMEQIVFNNALRNRLVIRGRARLRDFDWKRSADKVWDIVSSVSHET